MSQQFKAVGVGVGFDEEVQEIYLVVPDYVDARQIMAFEACGGNDETLAYDWVCECPSYDTATLVAKLMSDHFANSTEMVQ